MKEITVNKMVIMPMIVVPVIICVVLPAVLTALALTADMAVMNGAELIEEILPYYAIPDDVTTLSTRIVYVFLNYTFVPLFMLVPIMTASVIAANSVVGEKERKTLETLLYTPITNREFLVAKQLSAFLPAVVVTVVSFAGYFLVTNGISLVLDGIVIVQSLLWIPAILLLAPAVSLVGLAVTLLVSLKSKSFMEAQQMSALVVIPFILLIGVQITGLVVFNVLYVIVFSLLMFALAYVLIARVGPKFERERIITTL
jgi:ABC-type Na+ efflux pump permease subunit